MATTFKRYNAAWPAEMDALEVELAAIRLGGHWKNKAGESCGQGLFFHYKQAMSLLWPEDDWHRWAELELSEILANKVTGILGPGSSNKTYMASKYALTDYFAFPDDTCILISSTDIRGLKMRVWGTIGDLFNRASEHYADLPGQILESVLAITTDEAEEGRARVLKKGIICIPCITGGRYIGLGKYVGIKQKRVRLIADEAQFMGPTFLDAISNLGSNIDFKAVIMGNPIDQLDPLGMACEPLGGWTTHPEPTKTTVWPTRFYNGKCINFVGTDSPNFDFPQDQKPRYPYMVHRERIEEVAAFWGKDSQQYYSQVIGVMKTGLLSRRIITRDFCLEHHATEQATWDGTERTKIYAVDAAYGGVGGDRCVGGWGEFGIAANGSQILRVNPPTLIPVSIKNKELPEDQIARFVKGDTENAGIPPERIFYDSTGRGTLGSAFARLFGEHTPVPVEFGGRPSDRPVRHDLFVLDDGEKRLKRCTEHYVDFVSELWFSARYIIESDQMRELPEDVMREGCGREYGTEKNNKFFVESKHDPKARKRMVRSPDLFDWLVTLIEGARQHGFKIQRLGVQIVENQSDWMQDEEQEYDSLLSSKLLTHH